jgi:uncharacterized protein (DUF2236 family)
VVGGRATPERPLTGGSGGGSEQPVASPSAARADDQDTSPRRAAADDRASGDDLAGLYGPDSEAWRLNREAALLLGAGPLAVLLQIAHPLVAEGVAQHSTFREDPWARLDGTLRSYLRIVYGSTATARAEIRRLNALHRTVTGPISDPEAAARFGGAYAARDPELSLWVHATLVWATLVTGDRWLGPVPRDRKTRFYAETLVVGRGFGIPDAILPADLDAFEAYVAAMLGPGGPVHPSAVSRDLASAILHPPLAPVLERGAVARRLGPAAPVLAGLLRHAPRSALTPLFVPAAGLLPPATREELGLPWGPVERALDAWLTTMWRVWRPAFPSSIRWFPQALAADRRTSGRGGRNTTGHE